MLGSVLAASVLLAQATDQPPSPASVAPAPPPAASSPAPGTPVRLGRFVPYAERKPVPYETVKGFVYFKLIVAGQEAWALLDTGAGISVIDEAFANARGLAIETTPAGRVDSYWGNSGLRMVRDVPVVMPGQFEIRAQGLAVMDLKTMTEGIGHKIDFIFGQDYLRNAFFMISPSTGTVQAGTSGSLRQPPGAPFITLLNGGLEVEALIGGQPVILALDTGSDFPFTLTPEAWARLGPSAGTLDGQAATDKRGFDVKVADVADVKVGPVHVAKVKVKIQPGLAGAKTDGFIGAPFFDGKLVVLDQKLGKLWVLPARPRPPAPEK